MNTRTQGQRVAWRNSCTNLKNATGKLRKHRKWDQKNAEQGQVAPKQREMGRHLEKFKLQLREKQHFPPQASNNWSEWKLTKNKKSKYISGPNENSQKAGVSVYVFAACSQDGMCVNENQNTGPVSSLEKLLHELDKCDWKTTEAQKMISRKCRAGPSCPQAARSGSPLRKV